MLYIVLISHNKDKLFFVNKMYNIDISTFNTNTRRIYRICSAGVWNFYLHDR